MNYIFVIGLLLFSSIGYSQKKELTLKDAVTGQFRVFGPDRMNGFQWIPNSANYSFFSKNYQVLYISSVKSKTDTEKCTIQAVNAVLGSEFTSFFGATWKTESVLSLSDGHTFYEYNVETKTGKLLLDIGQEAENSLYHSKSGNCAYTLGNNVYLHLANGNQVEVTANTDKNIVAGTAIARSEFGITNGLFFSPNGQFLAFYQKDETAVHDYPLLDITKTPGELTSIKYPMAGQASEHPSVGVFNTLTHKTTFIFPRGNKEDYLTNITFTPDNKFVLIAEVNRDQNHMWLNVYDANSGAFVKTLLEEINEKWVEPEHPAFFPSENSLDFVWISERDGFNNLYLYDFNGKLIRQLTANKFVTKSIVGAAKNGKLLYTNATGPNPLNSLFYSVSLDGKQSLLTVNEGVHEVSFSSDGNYYFDAFSNHSVAYNAGVLAANGKAVKPLLTSADKLASVQIGSAEISALTAKDGSKLFTRLIKPSNFDPTKKYPVMVYVYGGPHAQMITNSWLDGANLWMYWMAEQGYLVFTLDGRGSAERGFAFESQIHRRLGDVEMEDQLTGVDYLKSLPYVDANRLAIHGWSFGGFMTSSLMLRHPDVFKVGVAGGPVTDWKYYEVMYGERYMDRPEQNEEGYKNASLLNHAANLKGDLLLIHGTIDDVVVMQHNFALVKKFVELGIQMDFFPYPMHKHNVTGKDRVHLIEKVLTYILEKN